MDKLVYKELTCHKCKATEREYAKTGGSIGSKYYCQACYNATMDKLENEKIADVLNVMRCLSRDLLLNVLKRKKKGASDATNN